MVNRDITIYNLHIGHDSSKPSYAINTSIKKWSKKLQWVKPVTELHILQSRDIVLHYVKSQVPDIPIPKFLYYLLKLA